MNEKIDDLIEKLSWNGPKELQLKAIERLSTALKPEEFHKVIQPGETKELWENAAEVVLKYDGKIGKSDLLNLIEWLQDLNWPGASKVLQKLQLMECLDLDGPLEFSIKKAKNEGDEEWLETLVGLRAKLFKRNI